MRGMARRARIRASPFVPVLARYVMAYTAFGVDGPRIALALSSDGYAWQRLGLMDFSASGLSPGHDKDAAFFPEPVWSPAGVLSFAFYHRPMTHSMPSFREEIRIAYVPLEAALADRSNLLKVAESIIVSTAGGPWALIKGGAGTPPIRIAEGLLSVYHGVDRIEDSDGTGRGIRYSAGLIVHDAERPHLIRYRSPNPIFMPYTIEERNGIVNDVVFPTGIDVDPTLSPRTYDIYYGMADARIGRVRLDWAPGHLRLQPNRPA
jgi:predicted GH43/DUF377 family glycosyl hydrolase